MGNLKLSFVNCLRHAFFSGAGYGDLEKISDEDQRRWCSYDPPEVGSFKTMETALAQTETQPRVKIQPMKLSDGRTDYFVEIRCGDRSVTPHVFGEEYKAAYHVALYEWLMNGGDAPDLMEFGPEDFPARHRTCVSQDAALAVGQQEAAE